MKWMENDFLAMKKFCPWLKTHFLSISQANMYFFSIRKDFLSGQRIFCPGRLSVLLFEHLISEPIAKYTLT